MARDGLPRGVHEAPMEYLGRVTLHGHARWPAVHRLTGLFQRARFSHRPVDEEMRGAGDRGRGGARGRRGRAGVTLGQGVLLAVGAVVLALLVPRPARTPPPATRRACAGAAAALARAATGAPRPTWRRSTACSRLSVSSAEDEYVRLRPLVLDIARQRLADHTGVRLDDGARGGRRDPRPGDLGARAPRPASGRPTAGPRDRARPPAGHGRVARADRGAGMSTPGIEDTYARCQTVLDAGRAGRDRQARAARDGADGHPRRRPRAARGLPGPRQDARRPLVRAGARDRLRPRPVHARPDAGGRHRLVDLPPGRRDVRVPARAGLHEPAPGRRDQPRPAEDAVGAARGDGRAAGDDRGRDAPAGLAVPRHRHPEPDRVRGHLPAARGAARPLPDAARDRLPGPRRRVGGARAAHASGWPTTSRSSRCARATS